MISILCTITSDPSSTILRATIDTGAQASLTSPEVAEVMGIKLNHEKSIPIRSANGKMTKTLGSFSADVFPHNTINRKMCSFPISGIFHAMEDLPCSMLIGLNFLQNANINLSSSTITFFAGKRPFAANLEDIHSSNPREILLSPEEKSIPKAPPMNLQLPPHRNESPSISKIKINETLDNNHIARIQSIIDKN